MLVFLVNPCDSSPCKNGGTMWKGWKQFRYVNVLINLKVLLVKKKVCQFNNLTVKSLKGLKIFKI